MRVVDILWARVSLQDLSDWYCHNCLLGEKREEICGYEGALLSAHVAYVGERGRREGTMYGLARGNVGESLHFFCIHNIPYISIKVS